MAPALPPIAPGSKPDAHAAAGEPPIKIVLAQAALELVPEEIAGHPQVRLAAKKAGRNPTDVLLDQNQHHQACKKLEDSENRGRPDIVHYTLLAIFESPLAKQGLVDVAVHTRSGHVLRFRPDVRLPRGEARFHGVMAKVLKEGRSQDKDPLIWVEDKCTPSQLLGRFGKGPVVRFDEGGSAWEAPKTNGPRTWVLGAYPHGGFGDAWLEAAPNAASVASMPLAAWAVAGDVLARARQAFPEGGA